MDKLTNEMIVALANDLGLEPALLKSVQLVESAGRDGFLVDGRPQILFEGHIMYKEIKNKFGLDKAVATQKSYPTICFPKWDKSKYLGGAHEYKRLEIAKKIDEECALNSTSWGMFQIMGFNYQLCGCQSVDEMVQKMSESHEMQLEMMYHFLYNSGLVKHLKAKDWDAFAKGYNGPGYKDNNYDQKLRNTYENFKDKL